MFATSSLVNKDVYIYIKMYIYITDLLMMSIAVDEF